MMLLLNLSSKIASYIADDMCCVLASMFVIKIIGWRYTRKYILPDSGFSYDEMFTHLHGRATELVESCFSGEESQLTILRICSPDQYESEG